jgi:hypothetical protein
VSYFKTNLVLKKQGFNITELEDMIPYERDAYILMIETEAKEKSVKNNSP